MMDTVFPLFVIDTALLSEHALLGVPSALAVFYPDLNKPQTPSVSVTL